MIAAVVLALAQAAASPADGAAPASTASTAPTAPTATTVSKAPTIVVDGGPALVAHGSARPEATQMWTTFVLRGAARGVQPGGFAWGAGARAGATWPRDDGTRFVGSTNGDVWLEGQGDVGWRFGDDALSVTPLAWGGTFAGARLATVRGFDDVAFRPAPIFGARVGAGALLAVAAFRLRWELGVGLREHGLETSAALTAGAAF